MKAMFSVKGIHRFFKPTQEIQIHKSMTGQHTNFGDVMKIALHILIMVLVAVLVMLLLYPAIHEAAHALAAKICGAEVLNIEVFPMSHTDIRVRQNKSLYYAFGELRLLVGYLWDIVEYNKESDYLLWLEKHNNQISVSECPKEIDFEANEMLFDNYTPTILVSATLANTTEGSLNEQYGYLIRNVGFPKDKYGMLSKPKLSPFPYNQNAMI